MVTAPNIPLATLFERVTHDGRRYLVGRIGNARILVVPTKRISRGDPVWEAVITDGPHTVTIGAPNFEGDERPLDESSRRYGRR